MNWDDAIKQLFSGPHATFVAERKRLAAELKTAGDKDGAKNLAKLGRPPISAWAVNQLWWHARADFESLLAAAKRVRDGDFAALPEHKASVAALRARAAKLLTEMGNAAADNTLQRIETTLTSIAAVGNFDPEPAGALTDDKDPPGFSALGIPVLGLVPPPPPAAPAPEAAKEDAPTETETDERETESEPEPEPIEETQTDVVNIMPTPAPLRLVPPPLPSAPVPPAKPIDPRLGPAKFEVERARGEVTRLERELTFSRERLAAAEAALTAIENS